MLGLSFQDFSEVCGFDLGYGGNCFDSGLADVSLIGGAGLSVVGLDDLTGVLESSSCVSFEVASGSGVEPLSC